MRHASKKTAARARACRSMRMQLMYDVGRCEVCGNPWKAIEVHEIARGANRLKALDKRYAVLVVCRQCHDAIHAGVKWTEAMQLAVLRRSRPGHYDLARYNELVGYGPKRITEDDVDGSVPAL